MILATAATTSPVKARLARQSSSVVVLWSRTHSRSSPMVLFLNRSYMGLLSPSMLTRVTSSFS